jgi:hypothetical protein
VSAEQHLGEEPEVPKSYQSLPHVTGKPFVLALTPFDQPFFYLEVQRAIEQGNRITPAC